MIDAFCFAPTAAGLDRMLNFIAVLDTLLLGVVVSAMTAVSFDEMQDHWSRLAVDGYGDGQRNNLSMPEWSFCSKPPLYNPGMFPGVHTSETTAP